VWTVEIKSRSRRGESDIRDDRLWVAAHLNRANDRCDRMTGLVNGHCGNRVSHISKNSEILPHDTPISRPPR
jgi:hypothetical protein